MKKLLVLLLALVCVFAFAACKETPPAASQSTASEAPVPEYPEEPEVPAEPEAPAASEDIAPTADDDLAYILYKGAVVIGVTDYEPMDYLDADGKWIGFDAEFAEAVSAKLGVTPKFQEINWDTKEIELAAGNIDVIWNGLTVTEERRENMDFSDSYLRNRQVVVVKAADAANYPDVAAFAGKTVTAEAGSAGETSALSDFADATYIASSAQSSALLEVKAGTSDAAIIDYTMAVAMTGEGTDNADLVALEIPLTDEEYAIGFRLGSTAVARFNEIIAELVADGTIDELAVKYGVDDLLIK
ncbi:MAG: transporter substrate-binding domain-containing protein [Oscillospiraceae bacterium]|jgi:polar amino acid transport system substrate-binding protein|nr:transporter substrate-binding domain-containing protein [Oscillospiraceae bacterium]